MAIVHLTPCGDCCDMHVSPCNGTDRVPGSLTMTASFDGNSVSVPLTWVNSPDSVCITVEGWEYSGGPEIEICSGLKIVGVALCCGLDTPGLWRLDIAVRISGVLDSFRTGTGLNLLTVVSTNPVHYTTQTTSPFSACSVVDDLLIDIQPTP